MKSLRLATALLSLASLSAADPQKTTFVPLGQNSYRFDWQGTDGWTYFTQYSTNLVDWFYFPELDQGTIHDPLDMTPLNGANLPLPELFVRLKAVENSTIDPRNADFDGDGISNWDELTIYGTDPLKFSTAGNGVPDGFEDTDGDGMSDQWERMLIDQTVDPSSMTLADIRPGDDFDGDGVSNLQEYFLGLSGYQKDTDGDGYSDRLSVNQSLFLKLDETTGAVASDSSREPHNGSLTGAVAWLPAAGVSKGALQFHGGTDAVQLPAATLNGLGNFTVSLWFKTVTTSNQTFLSSASATQLPALAIGIEGGNLIRVNTPGGSSTTWTYTRSLADGLWHHLVVLRNAGTGKAALRLDGVVFGTDQSVSATALAVSSVALGQKHLTASTYDPARAFVGSLDEVRIWSDALEPVYISELFRSNDLDQDGLPDDYEMIKAGNLTTLTGVDNDSDGDGKTDRQEFEAGTDPVDYYNGHTPVITLVSGGGQIVYNRDRSHNPLVFLVTDGTHPLVNAPVDFAHPELLGQLETTDGGQIGAALKLRTGADGKVAVYFKAD